MTRLHSLVLLSHSSLFICWFNTTTAEWQVGEEAHVPGHAHLPPRRGLEGGRGRIGAQEGRVPLHVDRRCWERSSELSSRRQGDSMDLLFFLRLGSHLEQPCRGTVVPQGARPFRGGKGPVLETRKNTFGTEVPWDARFHPNNHEFRRVAPIDHGCVQLSVQALSPCLRIASVPPHVHSIGIPVRVRGH